MAFIDDIERELRNVIGPKSKPKVNMNTNNNFAFGLFIIVLLVVGGVAAWFVKESQKTAQLPAPSMHQNPNYYPQLSQPSFPQSNSTTDQKVDLLIRQYQLLAQTTQKVYERGQWTQDRMRLMGTINNHNLAVVQGNLPRNELIYLNEDWTISRMPDRIYLDAETQEFLRKFIRARVSDNATAKQ